jgi:hypothetical protein
MMLLDLSTAKNDQIGLKSAEAGALFSGRPVSSHRLTNPDG